jgi:WD40 repeat protein
MDSSGRWLAAGGDDGLVRLYEPHSGAAPRHTFAHDGGVLAMAWHPKRAILATAGEDGAVRLWGADGAMLGIHQVRSVWIEDLAWSPDGALCVAAAGKRLLGIDAQGALAWESAPHTNTIVRLAWRPDGKQLAAATYGGMRLYRPDGTLDRVLEWRGSLLSAAWRPDGTVVASGCQDSSVHFWRAGSWRDSQMTGYPSKPDALSWSAGGRWLATGGADMAVVWRFDGDGPEGTQPVLLAGHSGRISALSFGPSDMLLSGGVDGRVALWKVRRGSTDEPLTTLEMDGEVTALGWSQGCVMAADSAGELILLSIK